MSNLRRTRHRARATRTPEVARRTGREQRVADVESSARPITRVPAQYYWLLGTALVLLFLGLLVVFSASSVMAYAQTGDSYFFVKRQALWVAIGVACLALFSRIDYHYLRRLAWPAAGLSLLLLAMVMVPDLRKEAGGAGRWLDLGMFSFQPSEIAKLAVVLLCSDLYARKRKEIADLKELMVPAVLVVLVMAFMVLLQPDLGTAFLLCMALFIVMYAAGARWRHIAGLGVAGFASVAFFIVSEGYRRRRFLAFLDPWADPRKGGYHIIQSLLAFGSGGVTGVGLGMSRQKFGFLPAAHTDFIFPIIGEELGFIGTLAVVILFALLAVMGVRIAVKARDRFGALLATGLITLIVGQALINMGAVVGLLPITGVPLPLISAGGTSVVFTLSSLGILLNIAYQKGRRQILGVVSESHHLGRGDGGTRVSRSRSGRPA